MYPTLFFYLSKQFRQSIYIILAIVIAVFLVSNYVDLLTRAVNKNIGFYTITKLALAKVPYLLQEAVPFLVFIAAILAFTRLSKSNEYTIIKASGVSIWQLLLPFLTTALLVGILFITVLNPIATSLMEYTRKSSNKHFMGNVSASMLSFSHSGLWFFDKYNTQNDEKRVVHAKYLNAKDVELVDVSFLILDKDFNFLRRIDSSSAKLFKGNWEVHNAREYLPHELALEIPEIQMATNFKEYDLKNSFVDPQSVSIWQLGYFISILKASGYSALQHTAYFYKLLLRPIFICGLVLIAASFSLRPMRFVSSTKLIFVGISSGFILFFCNELISLLGANGSLPSAFAAIVSALSVCMIGAALILHTKDG